MGDIIVQGASAQRELLLYPFLLLPILSEGHLLHHYYPPLTTPHYTADLISHQSVETTFGVGEVFVMSEYTI